MKRNCLVMILIGALASSASAGQLTYTTYYPAPSGKYQQIHTEELKLSPFTPPVGACQPGSIHYDGSLKLLRSCQVNSVSGLGEWAPFQGVWKQSGTQITLSDPDPALSIDMKSGSIFSKGTVGAGAILSTSLDGAGAKFIWYPAAGSIRAGIVDDVLSDGTAWNVANIGAASVAFGQNNKAKGTFSAILGGHKNEATNQLSTVVGGATNHAFGADTFIGGGVGNYAGTESAPLVNGNRTDFTSVVGGLANSAQGHMSAIVSGNMNYTQFNSGTNINSQFSIIGGGQNNTTIGTHTGVLGGKMNKAQGTYSAVVGGLANSALGYQSFVGGGGYNSVSITDQDYDKGNIANGDWSVIAGGEGNNTKNAHSAITGGKINKTYGNFSAIGGGENNTTGDSAAFVGSHAFVGGGSGNTAEGNYSAVSGGISNRAEGPYSTISGGFNNRAQGMYSTVGGGGSITLVGPTTIRNTASGNYSVVAGGQANQATKGHSTVSGGLQNFANGLASTIGGGELNSTEGDHSWAGGKRMQLGPAADNTFVWGNAAAAPGTPISAANAFLIFPYGNAGNVGVGTSDPKAKIHVAGGDVYLETVGTGVILKDTVLPNVCYRLTVANGVFAATPAACP